jgi:hypothetical protein
MRSRCSTRADQDARRTAEAAGAEAKRIVERAERRRAQVEALIAEFDARRDEALRQGELASVIEEHESAARLRGRGGREGVWCPPARAADPVARP